MPKAKLLKGVVTNDDVHAHSHHDHLNTAVGKER